jgi:hypothetical protein
MHEGISPNELEQAVQPLFKHLNRCPQIREMLRAFWSFWSSISTNCPT